MKVILIKDFKELGVKGEIKNVKQGYFYNYLQPQAIAEVATGRIVRQAKSKEKQVEEKKEKIEIRAEVVAGKLKDKQISIEKAVGEKDQLYAQVKPEEVIIALEGQLKIKPGQLEPAMIIIQEVIKKAGEYTFQLKLSPKHIIPIKIVIKGKKEPDKKKKK